MSFWPLWLRRLNFWVRVLFFEAVSFLFFSFSRTRLHWARISLGFPLLKANISLVRRS